MTQTVLRIAHLSVNNADGIPCGPYFAYRADETPHTCESGWDWMDRSEADLDCFKCRLYIVSETLEDKSGEIAPVPIFDGLNGFDSGRHHSGFASQEQVMSWMGDVLDLLHDAGFALFVYDVDDNKIRHGGRQVAFEGKTAKIKEILPLIEE